LIFGILGLITGAIWAKHTWGAYWSWDVKQNMAAISVLIYLAYFVLKNSFEDREKAARLSGVYNIFAFMAMIPLLFVIPRMTDSLHPGNGGNPALGSQDLDKTMRMVFYPAVIGFILLGFWLSEIKFRYEILKAKVLEDLE
jgi:heme exporter protein C